MKCVKKQACLNCPFRKDNQNKDYKLLIKTLGKEPPLCQNDSLEQNYCAGAVISTSLSLIDYKTKKLRFYQKQLGKDCSFYNKDELKDKLK